MTEDEARKALVAHIKEEYGTLTRAAAEWDVSIVFVSKVTRGEKAMPEWMLNKIGYARKIVRIK